MWNFFETGHSKGEHDGVDKCVKRALSREKLKFEKKIQIQKCT